MTDGQPCSVLPPRSPPGWSCSSPSCSPALQLALSGVTAPLFESTGARINGALRFLYGLPRRTRRRRRGLGRAARLCTWWARPFRLPVSAGAVAPRRPDVADVVSRGGRPACAGRILRNHLRRSGQLTLRRTWSGLLPAEGYRTSIGLDRSYWSNEDELRLTAWMTHTCASPGRRTRTESHRAGSWSGATAAPPQRARPQSPTRPPGRGRRQERLPPTTRPPARTDLRTDSRRRSPGHYSGLRSLGDQLPHGNVSAIAASAVGARWLDEQLSQQRVAADLTGSMPACLPLLRWRSPQQPESAPDRDCGQHRAPVVGARRRRPPGQSARSRSGSRAPPGYRRRRPPPTRSPRSRRPRRPWSPRCHHRGEQRRTGTVPAESSRGRPVRHGRSCDRTTRQLQHRDRETGAGRLPARLRPARPGCGCRGAGRPGPTPVAGDGSRCRSSR